MRKKLLFIMLLSALAVPAALPANNLTFLNDINIRDSGMGGSSSPFADSASGACVNPSAAAVIPMQQVELVYYNLFDGALLSGFSYALPVLEHGSIAATAFYVNSGSIDERDANNTLLGTYTDSYSGLFVSYGAPIFSFLNAGATARYISHNLYNEATGAFATDFGATVLLPYNINIAMIAGNVFKSTFEYSSGDYDSMPLYAGLTAGISFPLVEQFKDSLKLSAGLSREEYSAYAVYHAGVEYSLFHTLSIRGGYNYEGFSAGATFTYNNASINYSLVQKPLDLVHRFSVGYSFGENVRALENQFKSKEAKAKYELIEKIKRDTLAKFEEDINADIEAEDYENAKTEVSKALIWAPDDPWFLEKDRELTSLIQADKIKKALADADSYMEQDSYIDAMVSLKSVLDMDPKNESAKEKFGRAQELVKNLGEKNLAIQEGNKEVIKQHFETGLTNYTAGNYEKAIEEWDQVIKASPMQKMVYNYIQKAQEKVRKKEQIVTQKKLNKDKALSDLYNSAVLQYSRGEFEKSIGLWREYLKQDPDNKEAKENLEKITKEYMELQKQKLEW
jgi:tetratricopeptide (TPR) repeat protein